MVVKMSKIHLMDEILSNKIAAGEVVEKCVSVVKELVENSIDANASDIKIELIESGTQEIKVVDNGIGMDSDTLNKVSDMFFTTKKRGSGLGVSLSKEIIEQHGGELVYNSVKGKGTRVIVTLPNSLSMS